MPETEYERSEYVKRYGKEDGFTTDINKLLTENLNGPIAVIIFAVFVLLCCCIVNCYYCYKTPRKGCCRPPKCAEKEKFGRWVWGALFFTIVVCLACTFASFDNESDQNDAISALPNVIDKFADWVDLANEVLSGVTSATFGIVHEIDRQIIEGQGCTNLTIINELRAETQNLTELLGSSENEALDTLQRELNQISDNLRQTRNNTQDVVDRFNNTRRALMITFLIILFVIVCLSLCFSFLKCQGKFHPSKPNSCIVSNAIIICVFFSLVFAAVVYFVVLILGDFCYDPPNNLLLFLEEDQNTSAYEDLRYFLLCNDPDVDVGEYPLQIITDEATAAFDTIEDQVKLVPPQCGRQELQAQIDGLEFLMFGTGIPYNKTYTNIPLINETTGVLGCFELNGRLVAFMNSVCVNFYDPLALTWELVFVIAFGMFMTEWLTKCLRADDISEDKVASNDMEMEYKPSAVI
eukprot:m.53424 g.53424  ORF g.53424 m.53424 type:complete len:465 (+) comp10866_c0_seq2:65-1459(+)